MDAPHRNRTQTTQRRSGKGIHPPMTHNRQGLCWQFRKGDGEELDQAREYARTRHEVPYSLTDLL